MVPKLKRIIPKYVSKTTMKAGYTNRRERKWPSKSCYSVNKKNRVPEKIKSNPFEEFLGRLLTKPTLLRGPDSFHTVNLKDK